MPSFANCWENIAPITRDDWRHSPDWNFRLADMSPGAAYLSKPCADGSDFLKLTSYERTN
jgi:hypothetical protein